MSRAQTTVAVALALLSTAMPSLAGVSVLNQSSNVDITITSEGQGVLSSGALGLDMSPAGLTEIGPGVAFESFLIQVHNFESCSFESYAAEFGIDGPLLGIQTDIGNLRPGRFILADSGFEAAAPAGHLESPDAVTLDGDLLVSGRVGRRGVDTIRVFIAAAAVPEVASAAVWGSFFVAGLVACGRNRDSAA